MFVTRLISGIILVILALITMGYGEILLLLTLMGLSLVGYLELTKASGVRKNTDTLKQDKVTEQTMQSVNGLEIVGILGILAYYGFLYGSEYVTLDRHFLILFAIILLFMATMFVYVFAFPKFRSEQVMSAFFSFVYAPVCLSFIYLTRQLEIGIYVVWLILLCSWGCDTCAYAVGILIGKHKMSPHLSPKKSIEGAVGGVVGAIALGALYGLYVEEKVPQAENIVPVFAVICGIGALISMVGDLAASAIKRNHDIKDYGKLIPGHGGVMDRFDSVIFTAPIIYFLAMILLA